MSEGYERLFAAIYKKAVIDDNNAIQKKIIKGLQDMAIKRREAMAYISKHEEIMAEIKRQIQHNIYAESQDYGDGRQTKAMQARSLNSFKPICDELVGNYRMTDKEKEDKIRHWGELEKAIVKLIDEKESWLTVAEKVTPTLTGMPSGGDGENQRELAICNMVECEKEIDKAVDRLCDFKAKIKRYIDITGDDEILVKIIEE